MRIISIKLFLWPIIIALLMFSYPIQVMMFTPLPSVFPYIGFFLIVLITRIYDNRKGYMFANTQKIDFMISIYIILVIFHATWQSLLGFITIYSAISSIFIYVFPVFFYVYFKVYGSEREIRAVLITIIISGLISGLYFVYDSYSMLVLGKVNDFSYRMIDYAIMRAPEGYQPNIARISASYRSHGLLENHSISAAWISISCFSTLALLPRKRIFKRSLVVTIFGVLLCLTLNFTSIISFFIVVMFIEFQGHLLMKAVILKSSLKKIAITSLIFILFGSVLIYNLGEMADIVRKLSLSQLGTLTGEIKLESGSEETFVGNFLQFFKFQKICYPFRRAFLLAMVLHHGV